MWSTAPTIDERLTSGARANNFDALRLIASSAVILSHSFPAGEGIGTAEPMSSFTHGTTLGTLAVAAFFIFSGLLVAHSAERSKSLSRFARSRALRIFPGLAALTLVTTFVVGPLVTRLPLAEYFTSRGTWDYLQGMYLRFRTTLPGVFEGNPYPASINNSLWSLRIEVAFYVLTGLLLLVRLHRPRTALVLLVLGVLARHLPLPASLETGPGVILRTAISVAPYYLVGACFYFYRRTIRLSIPLALVAAAVWVLSNELDVLPSDATVLCGAYVLVVVALSPAVRLPRLFGDRDLSYGVYLYGWPAQQVVAANLGSTPWYVNALVAIVVVVPLAYLSWTFVERPALALKTAELAHRKQAV